MITENGYPSSEEGAEAARNDRERTCYLKQYLRQLSRAMREGVNVRGYFVWTLLDNFEWAQGMQLITRPEPAAVRHMENP